MGAGQSDLYKKTYGDNIDNIPDEANPNSKEKYLYVAESTEGKNELSFTTVQKANIQKVENTIADHLTEEDYRGAIADLEGNPIERRIGGFFNHKQEMMDSFRALKNATESLQKSLDNPNLGENEKQIISTTIKRGADEIAKIETLLKEYGGL